MSTKSFSNFFFHSNLFSKNWFLKHKNSWPNVLPKFGFVQSCFRGNDFATIKIFQQKNFFKIFFHPNRFSRKWFCNHQNCRLKIFLNFFYANLFSNKRFCNHKNSWPKCFVKIFFVQYWFRGNDFASIENFQPKIFFKIFFHPNRFSRKWFCNHKNCGLKTFLIFFYANLFSNKWFCIHKNSWLKCFVKIFFVQSCFRGNDFATIKIVD